MNKAHSSINWENYPSDETPLNERNLNKMDSAIELIDDRVIALDATKAAKTEVAALVADVTFEESTGIFTITKKNGSQITIDTKMEKIAVNFTYNPTTQQIILTLIDGTKQYIDLSALITQYEFLDTDTVAFGIGTDGKVSAIVKEGSIGERHLEPNYLAKIKVEAAKAQTSASNAAASEENAAASAESARASAAAAAASESSVQANATAAATSEANAAASAESARASAAAAAASESSAIEKATSASESATIATEKADVATQKASEIIGKAESAAESATKAESYAVGGTGSREGEDLDNAKYYYHQAKSISESFSGALRPMGTVTFDALPPIETATAGDMYNVSDQFTTTDDFKEGAGNVIPAGANIYKTSDDKWDVLAGTPVTGIKGANETIYRRGNVNLTADDVGSYAKESIDLMMEKVSLSISEYLDEIQSDGMVIHSQNWTTVNYLKSISSSLNALLSILETQSGEIDAINNGLEKAFIIVQGVSDAYEVPAGGEVVVQTKRTIPDGYTAMAINFYSTGNPYVLSRYASATTGVMRLRNVNSAAAQKGTANMNVLCIEKTFL